MTAIKTDKEKTLESLRDLERSVREQIRSLTYTLKEIRNKEEKLTSDNKGGNLRHLKTIH